MRVISKVPCGMPVISKVPCGMLVICRSIFDSAIYKADYSRILYVLSQVFDLILLLSC
jgi:hypothetical protein